eukprot:7080434-Alexandrium_andersonii.AAC.1
MSASLVGSEMCIRDSINPSASVKVARLITFRGMGTGSPSASGNVAPFATVSYTHLTLPTICSV